MRSFNQDPRDEINYYQYQNDPVSQLYESSTVIGVLLLIVLLFTLVPLLLLFLFETRLGLLLQYEHHRIMETLLRF